MPTQLHKISRQSAKHEQYTLVETELTNAQTAITQDEKLDTLTRLILNIYQQHLKKGVTP